jgi:3-oxoacid CoA-transferase subunit A
MQKIYPEAGAALEGLLFDGMTICAGGFGLCGIPERLIDAIQASGVKDLTIASNNAGIDNEGSASCCAPRRSEDDLLLCRREQGIRAAISGRRARGRILPARDARRALPRGGAGIPGFYTKTGVGTLVAEGKEHKEFDGETYILERGIRADLSIVKG